MKTFLAYLIALLLIPSISFGAEGWFVSEQAEEDAERRRFQFSTISIDLGAADLQMETMTQRELRTQLTPGQKMPLLIAGSLPDSDIAVSPFVHNGQWLSSPEGIWSAIGWRADHQPVFASTYLQEQEALITPELSLSDATTIPLAINRSIPDAATLFTSELFTTILPKDPDAFWAVLMPRNVPNYLVQAVGIPSKPITLRPDWRVISGVDSVADALSEKIRRGQQIQISMNADSRWAHVQEAFGLGMPLVWNGRAVQAEDLVPEIVGEWDTSTPARPTLAFYPRDNKIQIIWSKSKMQPHASVSRMLMIRRCLEQGASHVLELATEAPPLLPQEMQSAALQTAARRLDGAIFSVAESPAEDLVNLCRLPGVVCRTANKGTRVEACIDGRWGESSFPDSMWQAPAADSQGRRMRPWVEVNLGARREVHAIDILNAQAAGFSQQFNTASISVTGRERDSGTWQKLGEIQENVEARISLKLKKPLVLQHVRFEILRPNSMSDDAMARIAELQIWGRNP